MSYARDEIHSLSLLRFVQVFNFLLEIGRLLLKIGDVLLEVANLLGVDFCCFFRSSTPGVFAYKKFSRGGSSNGRHLLRIEQARRCQAAMDN